jgi:opacity protein-like surface antigen
LVLFFAAFLTLSANAQMRPHSQRWSKIYHIPTGYRDWMISASTGTALYYGDFSLDDLDPLSRVINQSNLSYSFAAGKWLKPYLGLRAHFQMGKIKAIKSTYELNSNFSEYSLQTLINISDLLNYPAGFQRKYFSYAILGFGAINYKSIVSKPDEPEFLNPGRVTEPVFLLGIGASYNYNQNFTFAFDGTYHYTNSDKLDGDTRTPAKDAILYIGINVIYNFNLKQINGYITRPKSKRKLKWAKF